jgi:predicted transposase/invertase (TIGR01784 family)
MEQLPVREFPDRGVKWLLESPDNVRALLRILAPELADRMDFARLERIQTTFVPDDLSKQESDLIFRAPIRDVSADGEREVLIYLLFEHQSTPDRAIGLRLLSYMVNLWSREKKAWEDAGRPASAWRLTPIVPILFYTGSMRWTTPLSLTSLMDVPTGCERFVPQHEVLMLNLKALPSESLTRENHPLGWVLRVLREEDAPKEALEAALREAVEQLDRLPDTEQAAWERAVYFILMIVFHRRVPAEHRELQQVIEESVQERRRREELRNMSLTAAQALIEEGKQLGLTEGKQLGLTEGKQLGLTEGKQLGLTEGKQLGLTEGKQEALLELLRSKFGALPSAVEERVRAMKDVEQLKVWLRAVLTASSLSEMGLNGGDKQRGENERGNPV